MTDRERFRRLLELAITPERPSELSDGERAMVRVSLVGYAANDVRTGAIEELARLLEQAE